MPQHSRQEDPKDKTALDRRALLAGGASLLAGAGWIGAAAAAAPQSSAIDPDAGVTAPEDL
ncbi:MAG TPA: hypothetical protein VMM92_03435, partial [Thermoanaerobaculia bacterium]|nr:hypothetical protein [Thermoanaerobaculia bacterium]